MIITIILSLLYIMFIYKNRNNIYITDFFTMKDEKVILKRYYFI